LCFLRRDLLDCGVVGSPLEEIDQGNFNAITLVGFFNKLAGGGRGGNGSVEVMELAVDGEVLAVVEEEGVSVVAFNFYAKLSIVRIGKGLT